MIAICRIAVITFFANFERSIAADAAGKPRALRIAGRTTLTIAEAVITNFADFADAVAADGTGWEEGANGESGIEAEEERAFFSCCTLPAHEEDFDGVCSFCEEDGALSARHGCLLRAEGVRDDAIDEDPCIIARAPGVGLEAGLRHRDGCKPLGTVMCRVTGESVIASIEGCCKREGRSFFLRFFEVCVREPEEGIGPRIRRTLERCRIHSIPP